MASTAHTALLAAADVQVMSRLARTKATAGAPLAGTLTEFAPATINDPEPPGRQTGKPEEREV